ncbi:hypothetical protein MPLDJ20_90296 [Mesorhizobium plurifarium]|uniref:Uncharacterized protein n=1 Tax=Mesorhizobium plurifarium TaxID=69974 RepID=A0A090GS21_MESPL|nr:hypothetical protein MPLDJ20_90296 [Mesorhizobium plurifarium]
MAAPAKPRGHEALDRSCGFATSRTIAKGRLRTPDQCMNGEKGRLRTDRFPMSMTSAKRHVRGA